MDAAERERRRKQAELLSGVGALVLGVGIGALTASALQPHAIVILFVGIAVHGWGMFAKHRIEKSSPIGMVWWSNATYWICWLLLALVIAIAAARVVLR